MLVTWISPWNMSNMRVQIRFNQKTDRKIERLENTGGGKVLDGPVFPHPTIEKEHATS